MIKARRSDRTVAVAEIIYVRPRGKPVRQKRCSVFVVFEGDGLYKVMNAVNRIQKSFVPAFLIQTQQEEPDAAGPHGEIGINVLLTGTEIARINTEIITSAAGVGTCLVQIASAGPEREINPFRVLKFPAEPQEKEQHTPVADNARIGAPEKALSVRRRNCILYGSLRNFADHPLVFLIARQLEQLIQKNSDAAVAGRKGVCGEALCQRTLVVPAPDDVPCGLLRICKVCLLSGGPVQLQKVVRDAGTAGVHADLVIIVCQIRLRILERPHKSVLGFPPACVDVDNRLLGFINVVFSGGGAEHIPEDGFFHFGHGTYSPDGLSLYNGSYDTR